MKIWGSFLCHQFSKVSWYMSRCGSLFIHCPSCWIFQFGNSYPLVLRNLLDLFLWLYYSLVSLSGVPVWMMDCHDWPSNFPIYFPLIFIFLSYCYTSGTTSFKDFTEFFLFMQHTFILFKLLLNLFFFCITLFWFHEYKIFYPVKNINNVIRSFYFFPIYIYIYLFLPNFFCVCLINVWSFLNEECLS